jgi:hypothetical protein
MTQEWAVGVIVAIASVYMVWRWMPAGLRRRLGRVHPAMGKAAGCGGCSSCGGCGSAADGPGANKTGAAPAIAPAEPSGFQPMTMPKRGHSRS